jgi:hypothetical protein
MDEMKQDDPGKLASNETPAGTAPDPVAAPFRKKFVELVSALVEARKCDSTSRRKRRMGARLGRIPQEF